MELQKNLVRKAVIPLAGFGTRMWPQALCTPKALLPIIASSSETDTEDSSDKGEVKPALLPLLDELLSPESGIEQVCLITSPYYLPETIKFLRAYEILRQEGGDATRTSRLKELFAASSEVPVGKSSYHNGRVHVVVQILLLGFGDAILCAKDFLAGEEHFLVALSDHIYTSGCLLHLLRTFERLIRSLPSDCLAVGLTGACLCGVEEVPHTGLLMVDEEAMMMRGMAGEAAKVVAMAEKPSVALATASYALSGCLAGRYFAQLGVDILPSSLLDALVEAKSSLRQGEELGLRAVIASHLQTAGQGRLYSCLVHGRRYDLGIPSAYWETLDAYYHGGLREEKGKGEEVQKQGVEEEEGDDRRILSGLRAFLSSQEVQEKLLLQEGGGGEGVQRLAGFLLGKVEEEEGVQEEVHVASSPGRVDLMGGFADYSGSLVLQVTSARRCYVLAKRQKTKEEATIALTSIQVRSTQQLLYEGKEKEVQQEVQMVEAIVQCDLPLALLYEDGLLVSQAELRRRLQQQEEKAIGGGRGGGGGIEPLWFASLLGVLHALLHRLRGGEGGGYELVVVSDVPWKTGLASSAAIGMSTALAVASLLSSSPSLAPLPPLPVEELAVLCQGVENRVVGASSGLMDQIAVGFAAPLESPLTGPQPLGLIAFTVQQPLASPVARLLQTSPLLAVVAVESAVKRSLVSSPYKQVRVGSLIGRWLLNRRRFHRRQQAELPPSRYLCELSPSQLAEEEEEEELLPCELSGQRFLEAFFDAADETEARYCNGGGDGQLQRADIDPAFIYRVRATTCHPVLENQRIAVFQQLLAAYTADNAASLDPLLRELMAQSKASYSSCSLGTDETDLLVRLLHEASSSSGYIVGVRVGGGGGGGALSVLVRSDKEPESFWSRVEAQYKTATGLTMRVHMGSSGRARCHGLLSASP